MTVLSRVNCAENAVNIPIKQINESEKNEWKESSELFIYTTDNRSVAVLYICFTFGRWFSCPAHNSIASACVASAACPTSKVCVQCVFLRVEVCAFVCVCVVPCIIKRCASWCCIRREETSSESEEYCACVDRVVKSQLAAGRPCRSLPMPPTQPTMSHQQNVANIVRVCLELIYTQHRPSVYIYIYIVLYTQPDLCCCICCEFTNPKNTQRESSQLSVFSAGFLFIFPGN